MENALGHFSYPFLFLFRSCFRLGEFSPLVPEEDPNHDEAEKSETKDIKEIEAQIENEPLNNG